MAFNKFTDVKIDSLDGGLVTRVEESKLEDNESPDLLNIDFDKRGSFELRKGTQVFGDQTDSVSGIKTLHNFGRRDGVEIPMRTWSTDVEYYNRQTSAWSLLSTGFTGNKVFGFADYDDNTYFCNDTDALFRWNGQYGTLSASHAASATVVEMNEDLTDWISAGEAIIGTQPIYYGSRTSGTLSAITGISAVLTADTEVAQAPTSSRGFSSVSSIPRGNILLVDTERLFVAGISSNYDRMYYSVLTDPTDFTQNSPRQDDDGGYVTIGESGGEITGLASRERGKILIFKKNTVKGFQFVPLDNTTTDFPQISNVANSNNSGATNNKGIINVESNVYYVSPIGVVRNVFADQTIGLGTTPVTDDINPTVTSLDPVSAVSIYHDRKFYTVSKDSDANVNNKMFVYDTIANNKKGAWSLYRGLYVNDFMVFDNNLYFAAANEKTVYKMLTGYVDDGVAYESYWKSKVIKNGIPHELKRLRYIFLEGYMTETAVVSCTLFYNDQQSDSKQIVLYGNASYVDTITTETFGDITFGGSVFGGVPGSEGVILNKFKVRLSYNLQNFFNYQFEVRTSKEGTVYRIDHIVPYVEKLDGIVFPVSNIVGYGS